MLQHAMLALTVLFFLLIGPDLLQAQTVPEELAPLPTELSSSRAEALHSLSPSISLTTFTAHKRVHRYFFCPLKHPLTPKDVALREAVRTLGIDKHRFVHCELKNHVVVTGAISSIGEQEFFVQTGILGAGREVSYRELSAPPRPVPAVGSHVKVGLEWTGFAAFCVLAVPLMIAFIPLMMAGVIQD
jgi:hypothetical protein